MSHQYDYAIGAPFTATGTAALNGTPAIVMTGGALTTEFAPGDVFIANGEARLLDTITDNNHATAATAFESTASGLTVTGANLKNLEDGLGLSPAALPSAPNTNESFWEYSQPLELASGGLRGAGWKRTEWRWGFVTQALREALRFYCPEGQASATVYIRTRVYEDDEFRTHRAIMLWPVPEKRDAGRRLEFVISFQGLVKIT